MSHQTGIAPSSKLENYLKSPGHESDRCIKITIVDEELLLEQNRSVCYHLNFSHDQFKLGSLYGPLQFLLNPILLHNQAVSDYNCNFFPVDWLCLTMKLIGTVM